MFRWKESEASETLGATHACILRKLIVSVMDMHTYYACTGHVRVCAYAQVHILCVVFGCNYRPLSATAHQTKSRGNLSPY